jgi:hypothetical protein
MKRLEVILEILQETNQILTKKLEVTQEIIQEMNLQELKPQEEILVIHLEANLQGQIQAVQELLLIIVHKNKNRPEEIQVDQEDNHSTDFIKKHYKLIVVFFFINKTKNY